ncbi:MAG: hypothetical protein ACT4TC_14840 [Myxococcaceae bacterium]
MNDESELKLLKEEISLLGPVSPSRRYPDELRQRILAWVAAERERGVARKEVTSVIGIPWETVTLWRRRMNAAAPVEEFQRVRVVTKKLGRPPLQRVSTLTLRTPNGHLVEGLTVDALALLLSKLR